MTTVWAELRKLRREAEKAPDYGTKDVKLHPYRDGYRRGYIDACEEAIQIVEEVEDE